MKSAVEVMSAKKGVSEARIIEMAIDWLHRCERITNEGTIKAITIELPDGKEKTFHVL